MISCSGVTNINLPAWKIRKFIEPSLLTTSWKWSHRKTFILRNFVLSHEKRKKSNAKKFKTKFANCFDEKFHIFRESSRCQNKSSEKFRENVQEFVNMYTKKFANRNWRNFLQTFSAKISNKITTTYRKFWDDNDSKQWPTLYRVNSRLAMSDFA